MKDKNEIKHCKKCKRKLPDNYKFNKCEHCRNQSDKKFKNAIKPVITTLVLGVLAIPTAIISNVLRRK